MLCPVCENHITNDKQCEVCGWEFVYFVHTPSKSELEQYELKRQEYRANFFYNSGEVFFNMNMLNEAIQCFLISCENNLYENPLCYISLSYNALGNQEEALKYANMTLEINPNNEIAKNIINDIKSKYPQQDHLDSIKNSLDALKSASEWISNGMPLDNHDQSKVTKEQSSTNENNKNHSEKAKVSLRKDQFETTEEYIERIETHGFIEIATVRFQDYNADIERLSVNMIQVYPNPLDLYEVDLDKNSSMCKYIFMTREKAKQLYELNNSSYKLYAKLKYNLNKWHIQRIKLENLDISNQFKIVNKLDSTQYKNYLISNGVRAMIDAFKRRIESCNEIIERNSGLSGLFRTKNGYEQIDLENAKRDVPLYKEYISELESIFI